MMHSFFLATGIAMVLLMALSLFRTVVGPTILDRILGGNVIGTKTTVLLLVIGLLYDDLGMFIDIALSPTALQRGYFNRNALDTLLRENDNQQNDHGHRLWSLLMLELWHRRYIDSIPNPPTPI